MSASLACQKAQRASLIADTADNAVTALVPADNIIDSSDALNRFPCIVLGEDQELPLGNTPRVDRFAIVHSTLHVWKREPGLGGIKEITGAIRDCLANATWTRDGWQCLATEFESARFLRDPDGKTAHGIVVFAQTLQRVP